MLQGTPTTQGQLPVSGDPRIALIVEQAERIWAAREDLRTTYRTILSHEFWIWLAWHGLDEYPALRAVWFRNPPPYLLERVAGAGAKEVDFLRSGVVDWRRNLTLLREHGLRLEGSSLLELGCGCGRVLRYFSRYVPSCMLTGADSDPEAVEWCRRELGFAAFETIPVEPPTRLSNGSYDAVLIPTLFEHLAPASQRAWLTESARVLRPGGLLVASFLGTHAVQRWIQGDTPSTAPSPAELRAELPRLRAEGHLFFAAPPIEASCEENLAWAASVNSQRVGTTFLQPEFVAREWTSSFTLLAHVEAPDGWQDYAVLRRR
jgi:SAM-dependent methyltransferase